MRTDKYTALLLLSLLALGACTKIEHLSPVPNIRYNSFTIYDSTDILGNVLKAGKLNFYFEDGDGDVGLKTDSTDLFFTLYRKINGVMVLATEDDPLYPSAYRIPYMVRVGQNKILRGTIMVTFLYTFASPGDTIKYDFYLEDRAYHHSNVASTSEIAISTNNIYR